MGVSRNYLCIRDRVYDSSVEGLSEISHIGIYVGDLREAATRLQLISE